MIKISFIGNISFKNKYNILYENKIDPFNKITMHIVDLDLIIGNLECLTEGNWVENLLKYSRLRTKLNT